MVPIAPCWWLIAVHNSVVQSFKTADDVIVEDPGRERLNIASQSFLPICFLPCLHEKPSYLKRLRTDIKHCMTQQQKPTSTPKWKKRSSVSLQVNINDRDSVIWLFASLYISSVDCDFPGMTNWTVKFARLVFFYSN